MSAFSIFKEEFQKEFYNNYSGNRKLTSAARERWKLLSDSDKAPYVLKAQKLKGKMIVGYDNEDEFEELDKSVTVKLECGVGDDHEQGSYSLKVNDVNIKKEMDEDEDELKAIITDFARFEEALTSVKLIDPPKATNLHKHLDELEKLLYLPLDTLLESANLIQIQNVLKLVKDLPLVHPKLREWCNSLLKLTMVVPEQRIGMQNVLTKAEAKAQTIAQLQEEAAGIRKTTLIELQRKEEYSTFIEYFDARIESLKKQLVEAEAERDTFIQLEGELAVNKHQRLKRARVVRDDLAPLMVENAAINQTILDSKNAIKSIDCQLISLMIQFAVLKEAGCDPKQAGTDTTTTTQPAY